MSSHERTELSVEIDWKGARETIVATVHWPARPALAHRPPVLVCLPGGAYNRRYFDLPEPGYSEAEHHAGQGMIVLAVDHLGVGESSQPASGQPTLHEVAAANHLAVAQVLERLRAGSLAAAGPVAPGPVIGVGQSLGGHIAVIMQALHRAFDGVAVLGSSLVRTRLLSKTPWREVHIPADADLATVGVQAIMETDWRHAFHWEDEPAHLVEADMAPKPPTFGPLPPWGSATFPDSGVSLIPAGLAREAAAIEVPVLIGMGERDVLRDPAREFAAYQSSRDVSVFQGRRMAHMHNFAGTRHEMWLRIDAFVRQVAMFAER
jgi:alpha-beta hydrolase superfamily lysophospholipase